MAHLDPKALRVFRIKPFVPLAVLFAGLLGVTLLAACSGQNTNTASTQSYKNLSVTVFAQDG